MSFINNYLFINNICREMDFELKPYKCKYIIIIETRSHDIEAVSLELLNSFGESSSIEPNTLTSNPNIRYSNRLC